VRKGKILVLITAIAIFLLLIVRLYFLSTEIKEMKSYLSLLQAKYNKVSATEKKLKELNGLHFKAPFFDRSDYLEEYVRDLVKANTIQILSIKGQLVDKDFSEVEINFSSKADDFFRFLSSIENAEKLLNIKRVTVKKGKNFLVDGNITVVGYNE